MQIDAPAEGGKYTLDIETELKWQVKSSASWVTCNPSVGKGDSQVKVTIEKSSASDATTATITISEYGSSNTENVVVVNVRRKGTNIYEPETSPVGAFSVADGKLVYFSQGNLQYHAYDDMWRFAEHQYDIIGEDNLNISDTYNGWIDLFGWGTGRNPTLSSEVDSDYSDFVDWGVNHPSNGGNAANRWRTLTKDEWEYIYSGRKGAAGKRSQGIIDGINGLILLPDSWSIPSGMSFTPNANDWTTNTYSVADWTKMEEAGAVFLPAAGFRNGTGELSIKMKVDSYSIFPYGYYWSSQPDGNKDAYDFIFTVDNINPHYSLYRHYGQSVRLVLDL